MITCRHCAERVKRCDCGASGSAHWVDLATNSRWCRRTRTWSRLDNPTPPPREQLHETAGGTP